MLVCSSEASFSCGENVAGMIYTYTKGCGYYGQNPGYTCADCPGGYYCPGDGSRNQQTAMCMSGYYKTSDANNCRDIGCTLCGSGYACPRDNNRYSLNECNGRQGIYVKTLGNSDTRSECASCESEYYCPGDQTRYACRICAAGEIARSDCTASRNRECLGSGYYWNGVSAVSCTQCPQGKYAKTPCGLSDAVCEACEAAYYCYNNTKMACPQGSTSPRNSISYIDCHCKLGYAGIVYSPYNTTCAPCPIGYFCPAVVTRTCDC